jgi:hypothetical protein
VLLTLPGRTIQPMGFHMHLSKMTAMNCLDLFLLIRAVRQIFSKPTAVFLGEYAEVLLNRG